MFTGIKVFQFGEGLRWALAGRTSSEGQSGGAGERKASPPSWWRKMFTKFHAILTAALLAAILLLGWTISAQLRDVGETPAQITLQGMSPQELQMLRHDVRKQKQQLIAQNLPMTESEAIKFWAVYQKYSDELRVTQDEKFSMMHAYAQNWNSMSNDDALIFMRRWLEVDEKETQLRSKYLPQVREALPGKKAATFFQLDERISMMIDLEFTSQLPLLHGARPQSHAATPQP